MLVAAEGLLDTTGGCCIPAGCDIDGLCWVFEPWAKSRTAGDILDAAGIGAVIGATGERLDAWRAGGSGTADWCVGYDIVGRCGPVVGVVEHGPLARAAFSRDGIEAFVSVRNEHGSWGTRTSMTIGKVSPFVAVDIVAAYDRLNALEGLSALQGWGGADTMGGSSRGRGTKLSVETVMSVVAGELA
jgi:hypothetical protein